MSLHAPAENDYGPHDILTLKDVNEEYQLARAFRIRMAGYARKAGLTNQEIGDAYGISEAAVRQMLKRAAAPDCAICKDQPKRGHYCPDCGMQGAAE